ncbi:MAG TPA: CNNM domain-containing protein, partial [bacterium]|nr:CNNM domain-containing protein [bacterium]
MLTYGLALALAAFGMVFFALMLAVMSASEQTFLSITEAQVRRLKERENGRAERVLEYVRRPHHVIVTTIVASGVFSAGAILCFLLLVSRAAAVNPPTLLVGGLLAGVFLAVF